MAENSEVEQLRVLVVEDSEFDARRIVTELRLGGFSVQFKRVETRDEMLVALQEQSWDAILADYNLPSFSAPDALKLTQQLELDIPFIVISGGIGEDIAVQCMKAGAHDYLMKGNLARLAPAIKREMQEAASRAARRLAERTLRENEQRYRLLWETCPDAVVLTNSAGIIQFANPAVQTVFGYKPDEIIEKSISILQPEDVAGTPLSFLSWIEERRQEEVTNWSAQETIGRRKDGQPILIEASACKMLFQNECRFVGFIRDITARKMNEKILQENRQQFQLAREIQQALFPKAAPELPGFDIAGACKTAVAAGGDYFDFLRLPQGGCGLVVGDVTGHGLGPALLMAGTRAYLRMLALSHHNPGEILTLANRVLSEDLGGNRFVTLFLGRLNPQSRMLSYASAGHIAACLFDCEGNLKTNLSRTGPALGLVNSARYETSPDIQLASGDLLLLLTDGAEEATNAGGQTYGRERIHSFIKAHRNENAASIVEGLYQDVRQFLGDAPQEDDVTLVVLKVN